MGLGASPLASEAADDGGDDDMSMSIILRLDATVPGVEGRKGLEVFRMDDGMGEEPSILEGVEVAVAGLREGTRATIRVIRVVCQAGSVRIAIAFHRIQENRPQLDSVGDKAGLCSCVEHTT